MIRTRIETLNKTKKEAKSDQIKPSLT